MKSLLMFLAITLFSVQAISQVVPNDSLYKYTSHENIVDSISVYRIVNLATKKYEKIYAEKIEGIELEISARGAQIDIYSPQIIEYFKFKGEKTKVFGIKAEGAKVTDIEDKEVFLYEDENAKTKSYFYFFPDQKNQIYRRITKKKTSDIIIYHISSK